MLLKLKSLLNVLMPALRTLIDTKLEALIFLRSSHMEQPGWTDGGWCGWWQGCRPFATADAANDDGAVGIRELKIRRCGLGEFSNVLRP